MTQERTTLPERSRRSTLDWFLTAQTDDRRKPILWSLFVDPINFIKQRFVLLRKLLF